MLRQVPRHHLGAWQRVLAAAAAGAAVDQTRHLTLFELFSKEKRKDRHRKLMDELNRGYFDDFKDFREKQGKVFFAPERLTPAAHAAAFPPIEPLLPDGSKTAFPPLEAPPGSAPALSLVCIAFRAGAEGMLQAWAAPFSSSFQHEPRAALFEIALIESTVMALWPFRAMLLGAGAQRQAPRAMPTTYLVQFGGVERVRAALHMTNRLTGYVYLVDSAGRVRWRGSGAPDARELDALLKCSNDLLRDALAPSEGAVQE